MEWITASDVSGEAWRRLLEFANLDLAEDALVRFHGPATARTRNNYRKQASQIRVALLQAREYFQAAEDCSVYTSPNHLYYGMASLASSVLLLRGQGTSSFDYLRKDPRNSSHGLKFSTGVTATSATKSLTMLQESHVEILKHGHFANWYRVLPAFEPATALVTRQTSDSSTYTAREEIGQARLASISDLTGAKFAVIEPIRKLPDFNGDLVRAGLKVPASRINHNVTIARDGSETHQWFLHGAATALDLDEILDAFRFSASLAGYVRIDRVDGDRSASVTFLRPSNSVTDAYYFSWPEGRERLDNEHLAFAGPIDTHELVDFYTASFGLSMLSRYFPDLWVGAIDAHGRVSKVVDALVKIALQKVPLLGLRLISSTNVMISAHKPSWF